MRFHQTVVTASCLAMAAVASAQVTSGNIAGVVKDASGAAVAGATVSIRNQQTGVTSVVKSNGVGQYLVQNLLPGPYDVTVETAGFANTVLKGVPVTLNATSTADVTVNASAASTEVEVSASTVVLDTTTQNLTQSFQAEELSTLPITANGQGVLNASLLAPGVASTGGVGIGVGPSIAGQRPRDNNFTIEGIDNNNKSVTGPLVYVPNDAVGEFTLITTQFSPEFGHSAGGQFNTNIISGTNTFHGKVYEYLRNRNLNAASGSAGAKIPNPRYDYNRYGGQLGGPIVKNKLFFFGNFERQTTGQNASYYLCVPTQAGYNTISSLQQQPGFSANNIQQYLKYMPVANVNGGAQASTAAPLGCGYGNSVTITSGAANAGGAQTGTTQAVIPLGNYQVASPTFSNFDALTTGVDYTISPHDSFRARYIYNTQGSIDSSASLPTFWTTTPDKYHLLALSEFHTFTPNLINEARVGFNRFFQSYVAGNFAYPGLDSFPNLEFTDQSFNLGPDGNAPQSTVQNMYELTDNVSYTRGHHTIKIGFDGRKFISPQTFTQRSRGEYNWSFLSDFLHDYAPDANTAVAERSAGNHTYYGDQTAFYEYANDTWRATDKLTLNFGVRYEFTSVPSGERMQALNSAVSVPGLINFGAPQPSYAGIAPRFGIGYAPDAKTTIRAGFGMAYDVLFDNLGILSFPPQYNVTQDVGQGSAPAFSSANFLKNGGLPPGTGSGTKQFCKTGTGGTTGVTCVPDLVAQAQATSAFVPNQTLPYSENYTLTIEREITHGLRAEIGYVGTRGIHLPTQVRINIQPKTTASNYLPTYANGVALNGQGSNASTLAAIQSNSNIVAAYAANNFTSNIVSFQPYSQSNYNGLITNLQGHAAKGLDLNMSYTYSKAMDDATAEVYTNTLTPRRPQNPQCVSCDYSRSALDHTHRVTLSAVYTFKPFAQNANWFLKNLVGNWVVAPVYTYESPEYATVLGGTNGLLTGDGSAVGRTIINPRGVPGTGSSVTPITNASGAIIGYNAVNPNAYYIRAAGGALPNSARNTLATRPIDNVDLSAYKRFTAFERYSLEFGAQAFNALNHAQYTPGSVDDVGSNGSFATGFQTVTSSTFNQAQFNFGNNARTLQLSGKFIF